MLDMSVQFILKIAKHLEGDSLVYQFVSNLHKLMRAN
jgi:hypothetical protein